jgi:shikimate dehydrogenase
MRLLFSGGGTIINYDLIVNSTSAGLKDEQYPAPLEILDSLIENSKAAFDCIYGKQTPFLKLAYKSNIPFKDGEDMLLYQGVIAFELFTNTKATTEVVEAMRAALKN